MKTDLPNRKPLRLDCYDYSTPGAYFITFCTHNRKNMLSRIVGAIHESPKSQLTTWGRIVDTIIKNIPPHLCATIDRYVIMPNHIHLIILLTEPESCRAIHESPLRERSSLSKVVGYIKMNVWQRGYYNHVIRNQTDYEMIAKYIHENPLRWELDRLYSAE